RVRNLNNIKKAPLDSGFVIAIMTVLAYVVSYYCQVGFLRFHGISNSDFVEMAIKIIIIALPSLILFIFTVLSIYHFLLYISLFFDDDSIIGYAFVVYVVPWILFAFFVAVIFQKHQLVVFLTLSILGTISTYWP